MQQLRNQRGDTSSDHGHREDFLGGKGKLRREKEAMSKKVRAGKTKIGRMTGDQKRAQKAKQEGDVHGRVKEQKLKYLSLENLKTGVRGG